MVEGALKRVERAAKEGTLEGCSHLLQLLTCREKMFMVMASEGGQPGTMARRSGLAVVGLLATQYNWKEFDAQYRALDCQGSDPGLCAKILQSTGVVAIAAAVGASSSEHTFSSSSSIRTNGLDPALACFEHCLLEAGLEIYSLRW